MELKAYLSVLLCKGLTYSSKLKEFKNQIKERFNKEFSIQQIEEELLVMKYENENAFESVKELPEDY